MAIAYDLAMTVLVLQQPMGFDPLGDLRFNRLAEKALGAVSENAAQHVLARGRWQRNDRVVTLSHGGVLPGECALLRNQIQTQVRRLLQLTSSTTFRYS